MRLRSDMPPHSLTEGLTNADRGQLGSERGPEGLIKVVVQRHRMWVLYLCYVLPVQNMTLLKF